MHLQNKYSLFLCIYWKKNSESPFTSRVPQKDFSPTAVTAICKLFFCFPFQMFESLQENGHKYSSSYCKVLLSFPPASQLYNYSVQSEIYNRILPLHNWKLMGVFLKDHGRMSKHFLSYIILCSWVYSNLKESNKICTTHCPLSFSTMQFVRHYQKCTAEHSCPGNTEATIKFRLIIRWPSQFF